MAIPYHTRVERLGAVKIIARQESIGEPRRCGYRTGRSRSRLHRTRGRVEITSNRLVLINHTRQRSDAVHEFSVYS